MMHLRDRALNMLKNYYVQLSLLGKLAMIAFSLFSIHF